MKRAWWTILTVILAIGSAWAPMVGAEEEAKAEPEAKAKGFWVENASIDLGKIAAGQDAVATFIFHNDTDKEVKIIKAKPS